MTDFSSQLVGDPTSRWHARFLDNLPVGIFRTTIEGRFIFCNRFLAKMLGYKSVKELVNLPVIKLYQNPKNRGDLVQKIIKKGYVQNYPVALKKHNGSPISFSSTVRAVFDEDGMVIFLDGILLEGSDFHVRPNRQSNREKLEGAVEMAGCISHKLNQPLTLIDNYLSEILSEPYNQKKNYRKILKIQEQINKLIETVKKISNIKKYETMEYVAGIKIVDIDKAT